MSTHIQIHDMRRADFDTIVANETHFNAPDVGEWWSKNFAFQTTHNENVRITLYCEEPPGAPAESAAPVAETEPTDAVVQPETERAPRASTALHHAIEKRLAERAAERKANAIAEAQAVHAKRQREAKAKEHFIAELLRREGVRLQDDQVEITELSGHYYSVIVLLDNETRVKCDCHLTRQGGEFLYGEWDKESRVWQYEKPFNGTHYFSTLVDAAIDALDIREPDIELTDDDLPF